MNTSVYEHVLQQVRGCSDFLASLRCCTDDFKATSTASLVQSIITSVGSLQNLTMADCSALNKAVSESAFSDAHKTMLATAVGQRLIDGSPPGAAKKITQTFVHPAAYFTAADWVVLSDSSATMIQKVSRVAERLQLLNVTNPSEVSVRHIVALLASTMLCPCNSTGLHAIVLDVKSAIMPLRSRPAAQQLAVYPTSPDMLPASMMAAAYGTGDPPVMKHVDGMVSILPQIPMRSSNRAIAPHRAQHPSSSSSSSMMPVNWIQAMMQQMFDGSANMPHPLQRSPSLQMLNNHGADSPLRHMAAIADAVSPDGAPAFRISAVAPSPPYRTSRRHIRSRRRRCRNPRHHGCHPARKCCSIRRYR
jgi:hypothetical protein